MLVVLLSILFGMVFIILLLVMIAILIVIYRMLFRHNDREILSYEDDIESEVDVLEDREENTIRNNRFRRFD